MTIGYFIGEGDKTTCGGKVLDGDNSVNMYGIAHAREGDRVSCGKDGNTYIIVGGISYFTSNGRLVAGTLDSYSNCPCKAELVPSIFTATYHSEVSPALQAIRAAAHPNNAFTAKHQLTEPKPAAPFTPATQSHFAKTFARAFAITNSETGQPLANRKFVAAVDGREMPGVTDAGGLAHTQACSVDSVISLHVPFKSPMRTLTEMSESALMTGSTFKTTVKAQEVKPGQLLAPIAITVNDRAATREAIIRKVRALGHQFVERSEWGAHKSKGPLDDDWDYSMIALHHAGRSYGCGSGAEQMLRTQSGHQGEKFDDISYHFGIDCSGTVYEGRDIRFKGSSVLKYNTGVIGVVLLNNLTTAEEGNDIVAYWRESLETLGVNTTNRTPAPQANATVNLITALKSVFFISRFGGHREYPNQRAEGKVCPGNVGMELAQSIRRKTQLLPPPTS